MDYYNAMHPNIKNRFDNELFNNQTAQCSRCESDLYLNAINDIRSINKSPLIFKTITTNDIPIIKPYLEQQFARTTDFSIGGLLMWVEVFHYRYCIYKNTLFIIGVLENDFSRPAFSMPIGELPLEKSIKILREYCNEQHISLEFSAVPLTYLDQFYKLNPTNVYEINDWADYLYDAEALASLKGKKLSKKRNHVNRFMADYHDHVLICMTPENAHMALTFMDKFDLEGDDTPMAIIERRQTRKLIREFAKCKNDMTGAYLIVNGTIAAFTIGDIIRDTLFIHIEKGLRQYNGCYETINTLFARLITKTYPNIRYINREDDSGDPGLRKAKLSYHPLTMLRKFNVSF
ncbi:MAG: phosphatidylglycerol lysyltransferase domain-containing protein [Prevotella sp.]|nr:phosphatidylglycerol lysyltransferase domain-containing protein [Bacteroides sp.]MCM1365832.1 phosphatidylglycerol lysyltransferase domain-containing protein [Prevotella sp.]MCM1436476.1 phosphatidylglycerol lysyltransferase domain-containing protein [Prevotella sp.]